MAKNWLKGAAIAGVGGSMLLLDGCLSWDSGFWRRALWGVGVGAGVEFLTDNDGVFDLFQDDFGTGTQYDDRFAAEPTRAEPDEDAQAAVDDPAPGRP